MKILFDNGTPKPIANSLSEHETPMSDESAGTDSRTASSFREPNRLGTTCFSTTDKNMRYQQNLSGRAIAIVILGNQ